MRASGKFPNIEMNAMQDFVSNCYVEVEDGCVTPQYVSRMLGGEVPMDEIAKALNEAKRQLII